MHSVSGHDVWDLTSMRGYRRPMPQDHSGLWLASVRSDDQTEHTSLTVGIFKKRNITLSTSGSELCQTRDKVRGIIYVLVRADVDI